MSPGGSAPGVAVGGCCGDHVTPPSAAAICCAHLQHTGQHGVTERLTTLTHSSTHQRPRNIHPPNHSRTIWPTLTTLLHPLSGIQSFLHNLHPKSSRIYWIFFKPILAL